MDGNGNPVPQSLKRSKEERDKLIGGTLLNGGSLYVYGNDELYPREMRVNAETGKLEISDPITEAPEAPSNPFADEDFLRRKRVFDQTHSKKQEDKIIQSSGYLQQKQEERAEALAHNKEVKRRQIQAEAEQKAKAKAEPVKAAEPKKEAAEKDPEMLAKLFGVPKEKFTEDKKQEPEVKAEGAKAQADVQQPQETANTQETAYQAQATYETYDVHTQASPDELSYQPKRLKKEE